jgi:hypothetical protein
MTGDPEPARINRRQVLLGGAALGAAGASGWFVNDLLTPPPSGVLFSAFEDLPGNQYVGGLILPEGRVFGGRIPMRAHGNTIDPVAPQRVLFFARRPGTEAFEFNLEARTLRTAFSTPAGRHLAGHGLFSPTGDVLFTPEHDYETPRGVIGIRDAHDFRMLGEIDTFGLDPHEIAWLPDGRTLVVANGGILTHPRSFRRKLNIATMDPSLCLIDAASGRLLDQYRLPDHLLSIRHLAITAAGDVAAGLQYEGEPAHAPSVVALYRPGQGFELLPVPAAARVAINGYVASIAISTEQDEIAAACPMGRGIARWQLSTREFRGFVTAAETYGITAARDGLLLASQRDGTALDLEHGHAAPLALKTTRPLRWDDHWTLAPEATRPFAVAAGFPA